MIRCDERRREGKQYSCHDLSLLEGTMRMNMRKLMLKHEHQDKRRVRVEKSVTRVVYVSH